MKHFVLQFAISTKGGITLNAYPNSLSPLTYEKNLGISLSKWRQGAALTPLLILDLIKPMH